MAETRYCDNCLRRTEHKVLNTEEVTQNPRGRATYQCLRCGKRSRRRQLRPSSEVSY